MNVAAIDIGTNSFHLLVARIDSSGHIDILDTHKESVRFGEALNDDRIMPQSKINQAVDAINLMRDIADPHQPVYRVIATQATRATKNYAEIIEKIYKGTGLRVEIIDGLEEARLTYLGMRYCHEVKSDVTLGLDIGGGSTEVIIGKKEQILFMCSIKLGALTATKRFFNMDSPTDKTIDQLQDYILTRTAPLLIDAKNFAIQRAFATSGTAKAIGRLHHLETSGEILEEPNGYQFPSKDLPLITDKLVSLRTPKAIKEYYELDSRRSQIVLAGTLIFQSISELFRVSDWTVSTFGIREGIVLDTCSRLHFDLDSYAENQQWRSINSFAKKTSIDRRFAESVQAMTMLLFDQCLKVLPVSKLPRDVADYRNLLESAAFLNETGKFISFTSYHKHSYYLLANSNLLGFTREERNIIALINRFSRKKIADTTKQDDYPYLRSRVNLINFLAACIRISRCINRSRLNKVKKIELELQKGSLIMKLFFHSGDSIDAEIQALKKELKNVIKAWNIDISLAPTVLAKRK